MPPRLFQSKPSSMETYGHSARLLFTGHSCRSIWSFWLRRSLPSFVSPEEAGVRENGVSSSQLRSVVYTYVYSSPVSHYSVLSYPFRTSRFLSSRVFLVSVRKLLAAEPIAVSREASFSRKRCRSGTGLRVQDFTRDRRRQRELSVHRGDPARARQTYVRGLCTDKPRSRAQRGLRVGADGRLSNEISTGREKMYR